MPRRAGGRRQSKRNGRQPSQPGNADSFDAALNVGDSQAMPDQVSKNNQRRQSKRNGRQPSQPGNADQVSKNNQRRQSKRNGRQPSQPGNADSFDATPAIGNSQDMPDQVSKNNRRSKRQQNAVQTVAQPTDIDYCDLTVLEDVQQRNSTQRAGSRGRSQPRRRGGRRSSERVDLVASRCEIPVTSGTTQRRGHATRRRNNQRLRASVINLDGASSSDESENSTYSTPKKKKTTTALDFSFTLTPSPLQASADNSDVSDIESRVTPAQNEKQNTSVNEEIIEKLNFEELEEPTTLNAEENDIVEPFKSTEDLSSDSDEDLFFVDYNKKRDKVFAAAFKEIKKFERASAKEERESRTTDLNTSDCAVIELPVKKTEEKSCEEKLMDELDLSISDFPIKQPRKKLKKNKSLERDRKDFKKAVEELSKYQVNTSLSGDVMVVSDNEEKEELQDMTLLIRWNDGYIRIRVRQFQKFSSVYQEVAEKVNADPTQVLLWHEDKVISHSACPHDLKLKFADIIECGVQSKPTLQTKNAEVDVPKAGTIPIKVQNADKKGIVTIHLNKESKMLELMHRYAEEKNVKLDSLYFKFDGEKLDPHDTPETLDLEGGECIDVFVK